MSLKLRNFCRPLSWTRRWLHCGVICGLVLWSYSVGATESTIPWQCTSYTYTGNSQEECIQNLSKNGQQEQQETIAKLERQLKYQELALYELNKKIDRRMRRNQRDVQLYPPASRYIPEPLFANPLISQYGYGRSLGFGIGRLPFLPSIGIVIH